MKMKMDVLFVIRLKQIDWTTVLKITLAPAKMGFMRSMIK